VVVGAPQQAEARTAYPPEPWRLAGDAVMSLFAVPVGRLPATPAGFSPANVAGHGLVVAGWVRYGPGSVLEYDELFAAVCGTFGRSPTATVTHMWVNSAASRDGGRELWGYPKELADLDLRIGPDGTAVAWADGAEIARGAFRARWRLPRLPASQTGTVQIVGGAARFISARSGGRPVLGRGELVAAPSGPLGFLAAGRRLATVGVADFEALFGEGS
jgi:Acetoacetate decarboxylase (ADC)